MPISYFDPSYLENYEGFLGCKKFEIGGQGYESNVRFKKKLRGGGYHNYRLSESNLLPQLFKFETAGDTEKMMRVTASGNVLLFNYSSFKFAPLPG